MNAIVLSLVLLALGTESSELTKYTKHIHAGYIFREKIPCNCTFEEKEQEKPKVDNYLSFVTDVHFENGAMVIECLALETLQNEQIDLRVIHETGMIEQIEFSFIIDEESPIYEGSQLIPVAIINVEDVRNEHYQRSVKSMAVEISERLSFPLLWIHIKKPASLEASVLELMVPETYLRRDKNNETITSALERCHSGSLKDSLSHKQLTCTFTKEYENYLMMWRDLLSSTSPLPENPIITPTPTISLQLPETGSIILETSTAPPESITVVTHTTAMPMERDFVTSEIEIFQTGGNPVQEEFSTSHFERNIIATETSAFFPGNTQAEPDSTPWTVEEGTVEDSWTPSEAEDPFLTMDTETLTSIDEGNELLSDPEVELSSDNERPSTVIPDTIAETTEVSLPNLKAISFPEAQEDVATTSDDHVGGNPGDETSDDVDARAEQFSYDEPVSVVRRSDTWTTALPLLLLAIVLLSGSGSAFHMLRERQVKKKYDLRRPDVSLLSDVVALNAPLGTESQPVYY